MKSRQICTVVRSADYKRLQDFAFQERTSMGSVIRKALITYLGTNDEKIERDDEKVAA